MNHEAAIQKMGRKAEAGVDVFLLEEGILAREFLTAFARPKKLEQCLHSEAMPPNDRLPTAYCGIDCENSWSGNKS